MSQRGGGSKIDVPATFARFFHDDDSFISLDGREFLSGDDWLARKKELMERDGGMCHWKEGLRVICGKPAEHPHHVKHRSKGGDDSLRNLISLCAEHHREAHKERNPQWRKR